VSCKVVRDMNGDSKGSGFVLMSNKEEAKFSIETLHGFNNLVVKPADNDNCGWKSKGKGAHVPPVAWGKGVSVPSVISPKVWGAAGVLAPAAAKVEEELEMSLSCTFFGKDSADGQTCTETLLIWGLPSPQVEEIQLLELFISMGIKVGRIEVIPDDCGSQCSSAMVQFPSVEVAQQAHQALDGQKPSSLGMAQKKVPVAAKIAAFGKSHLAKGRGKGVVVPPSRGAVVPPGPYGGMGKGTPGLKPPAWFRPEAKGKGKSQWQVPDVMTVKLKDGSEDSDHVYMAGLPSTCTAAAITKLFGLLDMEVLWCKVLADIHNVGACTALVQLSSMENAVLAMASFDGKSFEGAMKDLTQTDDAPEAFAAEKWPELA